MPTPASVPATAISSYRIGPTSPTALAIGSTRLWAKVSTADEERFWFVVVDLSDLSIAANELSASNSTVPPSIQAFAGQDGYFLFFLSNAQQTHNLPQGALHAFLTKAGAASELHELEQIVEQMGTGWVNRYSYVLGTTMDTGDLPGFEVMSTQGYSTLVMQFVPVTIGTATTYAPALGAAE